MAPLCAPVPNPVYNTRFVGPTPVWPTNSISIGSAVFAGHTFMIDRHTDTQTTLCQDMRIGIARIYALRAMRTIKMRT